MQTERTNYEELYEQKEAQYLSWEVRAVVTLLTSTNFIEPPC